MKDPTKEFKEVREGGVLVLKYLAEINRFSLLTREGEIELAKRIKNGEEWARKMFIESNLRLVVHIVKGFEWAFGIDYLDKIQIGNEGLFRAVDMFDYNKGYRFSTYACNWIRYFIQRGIQDHSKTVRRPVHVWSFLTRYRKIVYKLRQELNRKPTILEIATQFRMTEEELDKKLEISNFLIIYVGDLEFDSGSLFGFCEQDEESDSAKNQKREVIENELKKFSLREKFILEKRFFTDPQWTLDKIGKRFNLSREGIRLIEQRLLQQLRENEELRKLI